MIGTRGDPFLSGEQGHDQQTQVLSKEVSAWSQLEPYLNEVCHLRLEAVELDIVEPQDLMLERFENLRVLMLYPWLYGDVNQAKEESTKGPDDGGADGIGQCSNTVPSPNSTEGRLLRYLLPLFPPSLRVVYIGAFRIWLQRPQVSGPESALKSSSASVIPISLFSAKLNPLEWTLFTNELNDADRNFLDSVPEKPLLQELPPNYRNNKGAWTLFSDRKIKNANWVSFARE